MTEIYIYLIIIVSTTLITGYKIERRIREIKKRIARLEEAYLTINRVIQEKYRND